MKPGVCQHVGYGFRTLPKDDPAISIPNNRWKVGILGGRRCVERINGGCGGRQVSGYLHQPGEGGAPSTLKLKGKKECLTVIKKKRPIQFRGERS